MKGAIRFAVEATDTDDNNGLDLTKLRAHRTV